MIIIAVYDSNRTGNAHDNDENRLTSLEQFRSIFLDMTYPVGSIYMSVNSTSPATLFGGAWEAIEGRFLIGTNSSYTPGSTGGSASLQHSHKYGLVYGGYYSATTIENNERAGIINYNTSNSYTLTRGTRSTDTPSTPVNTGATSSYTNKDEAQYTAIGQSEYITQTNLPPYLAVYMWKRTA